MKKVIIALLCIILLLGPVSCATTQTAHKAFEPKQETEEKYAGIGPVLDVLGMTFWLLF